MCSRSLTSSFTGPVHEAYIGLHQASGKVSSSSVGILKPSLHQAPEAVLRERRVDVRLSSVLPVNSETSIFLASPNMRFLLDALFLPAYIDVYTKKIRSSAFVHVKAQKKRGVTVTIVDEAHLTSSSATVLQQLG